MRTIHRLSVLEIGRLKPGRTSDGGGLYVEVKPDGRRYFIFRDASQEKLRWRSLGPTTKLSLKAARELAKRYNDEIALGRDPWAERVARADVCGGGGRVHARGADHENVKMRLTWTRAVEVYAAGIAQKRVDEIGVGDALAGSRPIWTTKFETASRVRGKLQRVMTYAKGRGWRSGENPFAWTDKLSGLLPTGSVRHSITSRCRTRRCQLSSPN